MKFITHKGEFPSLPGIETEFWVEDDNIKAIDLSWKDGEGETQILRIANGDYGSSLKFMVPAEPEKVERWYVGGLHLGLRVDQWFETEQEAQELIDEHELKLLPPKLHLFELTHDPLAKPEQDPTKETDDDNIPF